jgi:hypothetical protein
MGAVNIQERGDDMTRTTRGLIVGSLILLAGVAMAAETGRCYTAEVPAPIVLPNGGEYDAGELRICMKIKLSPVEGLHETSVDGHPIGGFRSRLGTSEAADDRPAGDAFFVFSRAAGGRLVLEGYAVSQGNRLRTYHLGSTERVTTAWWTGLRALNDESSGEEPVVRIAVGR